MRVSVIIVNWNGLGHLPECLDSLQKQTFRDFQVIVVDNGSSDGSVPYLEQRPEVRLVPLEKNAGFAAGNNAALPFARGEYLVTLNNDTKAEPDWLEKLVAVADRHPEAGMVGCRILSYQDPERVDSMGMAICRDGMSRGNFRGRRYAELAVEDEAEILFPSACVALYRRAMVDQIGFFDGDFFAYCEDSDLGLRGRLAGWQAVLARDAVVYHKYSMTAGTLSPLKLYLVERNHFYAVVKNFPLVLLLTLPLYTLLRYLVQARVVLHGKGTGGEFKTSGSRNECALALLRGMRDALLALPTLTRKRAEVMRHKNLSPRETMQLLRRHHLTFHELLDVPPS
ncbi:glycosyltransferase family 2 protein [Geomonas subterranea]|uniref:Glycosyltransferase family 2 protein n=1 Tax=Geomonas subterranea TaxID=2847989 RepID=A0ABX8LJP2_9BACT|nr:glycosyltransferase family 2 protein [Geomonas subterranea]QXE90925.1 glycosyltransferase family 2 protein [Geomonas subterranea]QXM10989.1 glycosyltransferase family 2 protein [Geomonas subterranea]